MITKEDNAMRSRLALLLPIAAVSVLAADRVPLTGKVTDASGKPLGRATVRDAHAVDDLPRDVPFCMRRARTRCPRWMYGMKEGASATKLIIMTIGHSTRPVKEFIQLLKAHQVKRLVDVRTVPRSGHNPQFNRSQLSLALHSARLHYTYKAGLGGFRRASPDSLNAGWHNASFRGFADYMQTQEFRKNLDDLITLARVGADRDYVC
jgi:hypothetical protein